MPSIIRGNSIIAKYTLLSPSKAGWSRRFNLLSLNSCSFDNLWDCRLKVVTCWIVKENRIYEGEISRVCYLINEILLIYSSRSVLCIFRGPCVFSKLFTASFQLNQLICRFTHDVHFLIFFCFRWIVTPVHNIVLSL